MREGEEKHRHWVEMKTTAAAARDAKVRMENNRAGRQSRGRTS